MLNHRLEFLRGTRTTYTNRTFSSAHKWPISMTFFLVLLLLPLGAMASVSTTTTLTLSTASAPSGTSVTMTAAVVDASSHPVTKGLVIFCNSSATHCEDSAILATGQLTAAGSAIAKIRLGVGSHSIQARFIGTIADTASNSTTAPLAVTGMAPSTTSLVSSGSVGMYTLTATVGGIGSAGPSGTVSFTDTSTGGTNVGSGHLTTAMQATSFQPYTSDSTGGPEGVASGDFNNDGIPDVVVSNSGSSTISIFLGNGDGTFHAQQSYTTGSGPGTIAVGDINSDGHLDVIVGDSQATAVSIFLGNGDGTLGTRSTYTISTTTSLAYIAINDVNRDGIPDLVVDNDNGSNAAGTVDVLLGNGDGTFGAVSAYTVGFGSDGLVVADLNGDGKPDIATANYGGASVSILLGNGDGTFKSALTANPNAKYPVSLVAGDFNGDGIPDLAVGNEDYHLDENYIVIMLGNGDGTFKSPTTLPTSASPWLSATGDFNGDGKLDLAVSTVTGGVVNVLLGNGDGTFQSALSYPNGSQLYPLAIVDLNGDGAPDLVVPSAGTGAIDVFLSTQWTATASVSNVVVTGTPSTQMVTATFGGDTHFLSSTGGPVGLTSGQATQTITFPAPSTPVTYGVAPVQLTATASSGLSITYSVTGPATVSGSTLSVTGAGTVVVTASQAGNANYSAANPVSQTITVNKAALTVTANNASKVYGAALPSFTAAYTGFVNGDTASSLSGSPSLTTTATATSSVGTYSIAAAAGTLTSSNYSFTYVNGTLTITAAVAATPTFSLAAGTYHGSQQLTITDSTSGSTIYYTTNGTTPTTSSTKYTTVLTITVSETVKAIAVDPSNYTQSAVMSAAYVIQ